MASTLDSEGRGRQCGRVCGVQWEWREVRQQAGPQGTPPTTPPLRRVGGSASHFCSLRDPYSPTEVKGIAEFFMQLWAYPRPRGQARDQCETCSLSSFAHAVSTPASSSLTGNNVTSIKLKECHLPFHLRNRTSLVACHG